MISSNKHLKAKISQIRNFTSTHNEPPLDLLESFFMELKVSKLYLPADFQGNEVNFEHLESDDGMMLLALYTAPEEYAGEMELKDYGFDFYAEIIQDCQFDGAIINPQSDAFYVEKIVMDALKTQESIDVDENEIYDAFELKQIADTVKNEELVKFIRNESNFNRFDELKEILSGCTLLNVVSSDTDLSDFSHNQIISTLEVGGFNLSIKSEGMNHYGLLFTSLDTIRSTCDTASGKNYYYQITSLEKILNFILMNDMEGVILNPDIDDYHIPRNVLLDIYHNHPEIIRNPKYAGATFYAFTL